MSSHLLYFLSIFYRHFFTKPFDNINLFQLYLFFPCVSSYLRRSKSLSFYSLCDTYSVILYLYDNFILFCFALTAILPPLWEYFIPFKMRLWSMESSMSLSAKHLYFPMSFWRYMLFATASSFKVSNTFLTYWRVQFYRSNASEAYFILAHSIK
jgi:hypothetical protein